VTAALAVAALGYAYSGLFSRYVADDFCSASVLAQHGLMGAQTFWYQNWSGRFTFVLVIDLLNALGAWTVPLTPPLLLTAWVAAAAAAVHPWLRQLFGIQARAWSPLLALLLVVASLGSAPAVWEDLYWQTGAVTYLMPIVLSLAFAATLWRVRSAVFGGRPYWPWIGLGAIMIAIAAGCSETAMAALVCALGLAAVAVAWRARGPARRPVALALAWRVSPPLWSAPL